MDIATILGVVLGFGVILASLVMGGGAMAFIDVPSIIIVVGGMLCGTMIHFSLPQFLGIFSVLKKAILIKISSPNELIQNMVNYAAISRRDGTLALEEQIRKTDNPFLAKGLQMLVDGRNEEKIRELLTLEIDSLQERHATGKKILEFMGAAAPAFGMIGTLIGLVQMLRNLTSPEDIGAGMAVALITTFYGSILANLVFIPMAGKLGIYSKAEIMAMEITLEGICTISRGENPTVVREKMQAFLAPKRREDIKANI
ncbi:MAG TPA: MotA/TolQ/ExbB proton channel family protein [Anaerohalosphaeraceae bacterium]|jgi:chemotaxis protein MotA|nr:MotA/TolQ/ExbB proton channel family protein [Anaerohalosphaeraceae bacterium]